jgi:tol-pal system protein YbgF
MQFVRPRWLPCRSLFAIGTACLFSGCRSDQAADRSMNELRAEITKLQANQDRVAERLGALEAADSPPRPAAERPQVETRPKLKVVKVDANGQSVPDAETEAAPAAEAADEKDSDRPLIQATGHRGTVTQNGGGSAGAKDPGPTRTYESALALVKSKQYDRAIEGLAAFLVNYPDSPLAENALYWRGECSYAKGDFEKAAEQFEGLTSRFPNGTKAPDAMLKLGMCQARLGATDQAQQTFAQLKNRFPKSEAVRRVPRSPGAP